MDVEFTVESFSAYLKDLSSEGIGSSFRLQLDTNTPSQKILDECPLIGLRSLSSQNQHISQVVAALELLLQFGAKWDNSTLLDKKRTPYHIICRCPNDPYGLLDKTIRSSGEKLVDEKDCSGCTAVMHAVHNKNIESLRCLIDHGADLNLLCKLRNTGITTALNQAIRAHALGPSTVTREIFNLLLESGVDINGPNPERSPIEYAIDYNSIECFQRLVQKDVQFNLKRMWFLAASNRSIDILRSLINRGISKNVIDSLGRNALHHAVCSGHITVIRYLLELGVTITTIRNRQNLRLCSSCTINSNKRNDIRYWYNPCLQAISMERLDLVQLLDNYEQQTFQSIRALKCAVRKNSLKIVNYLLSKHTYPLNIEYIKNTHINMHTIEETWNCSQTIITEACKPHQLKMVTLLMEHGADPAKKSDDKRYQSAIMIAIRDHCNELVAHFIRSGVNLDCRLHDAFLGDVLPFEYAVIRCCKQAAKMLLRAGGSCGEFSLVNDVSTGISSSSWNIHEFQEFVSPEVQKLMIEWDVHKNKVKPLQQLCRKSILHHLCPRTVKKITELPLPPKIIRYLAFLG